MKTAIISASTAGNTTVIAGIPGKQIRVFSYILTSHLNNFVIWKSGSTAISGEMHMPGGGNISTYLGSNWPSGGLPALQTATGEALIIQLDQSHVVGGHLTYQEISV